jgi:hypothetical protein
MPSAVTGWRGKRLKAGKLEPALCPGNIPEYRRNDHRVFLLESCIEIGCNVRLVAEVARRIPTSKFQLPHCWPIHISAEVDRN